MRILLIEDDREVANYIKNGLMENNHFLDVADNGEDGLNFSLHNPYDVMIIDRMIPKIDGLSVIKSLRNNGHTTPVLILSALDKVDDRVTGLRSGGDDYLVKPFAFAELLARIEILGRRAQSTGGETTLTTTKGLKVDLMSRKVFDSNEPCELLAREFKLLEYLMRHKGQIVTRSMLLEHVWDYNFDPQTNIIDVHISRLRSKIDKNTRTSHIKTVRGVGYIIEE